MTATPPHPTGEPGPPATGEPASQPPPWAPPAGQLPPPAVRPTLPATPAPSPGPVSQQLLHYRALGWRPAGPPPRRGHAGWVALVLALLTAVLLVPVAASRAGHPTSAVSPAAPGQAGPAGAQQGGQPPAHEFTTGDVRDLLDRYAAALVRHDQRALLAQLDRGNQRLAAGQRRLFGNLRQLDLATLHFVVVDLTLPGPDPARPGRYTVGWVEAWRQMQIRGIDPVAGAGYFRLGLKVAGDHLVISDLAPAATGASSRQPAPWDVSTLRVVRGANVLVAGTPDVVDRLGDVLRAAEGAIADAGPCWPARWQHTFTIFATGDRKLFSTWFRSRFTNTEFIGFEIGLPAVDGDGNVLAGRVEAVPQVVIDVPGALRAPLGFRQLLEHEMTHAASGADRNPDTETWAIEGYADFVAFHSGTLRQANRGGTAYRTFHSSRGLTVRLPANSDFYRRDAALNYDLAFLAFWYLRQRYGQAAVVRYFTDTNQHGAAAGLLRQHFHLTTQQFVNEWAKWTFSQLR